MACLLNGVGWPLSVANVGIGVKNLASPCGNTLFVTRLEIDLIHGNLIGV